MLRHYALRVWARSHYGVWQVYGHSRGGLPGLGLSFDVGVDCDAFRPFTLEEVAGRMNAIWAGLASGGAVRSQLGGSAPGPARVAHGRAGVTQAFAKIDDLVGILGLV